jgi:hypothetical protein
MASVMPIVGQLIAGGMAQHVRVDRERELSGFSEPRSLQHYMGHKNIMHTVRYTEMAPDRFKNFWKD